MEFLNTVLIVGGGGREHAIVKALLRTDRPLCLYAYPGNPGMENDGCMLVDTPIGDWKELADWSCSNGVELVVVGPEIPLCEGIVDIFEGTGIPVFGPSKAAAQLEGSKAFSKMIMEKYDIPTAVTKTFSGKTDAVAYLKKHGVPIVIKVSGLAAGKGAMVCLTMEEAEEAIRQIYDAKAFGSASSVVLFEDFMVGEEASIFVLTDGKNFRVLPAAQDHKRIFDNDLGPNTGGMGAYAPAPLVDAVLRSRIEKEVIRPTIEAMRKEGIPYRGLLYAGIMVTTEGPKVVEFNCRFGDPETQAVLPLVDCDWFEVFKACALGGLDKVKISTRDGACATVVLASKGYPGSYEKGKVISGLETAEQHKSDTDVYHAGTKRDENGSILTNGGRVLAVSSWADNLDDAVNAAYKAVGNISFDGMYYRKDIARKGLERLAGKM